MRWFFVLWMGCVAPEELPAESFESTDFSSESSSVSVPTSSSPGGVTQPPSVVTQSEIGGLEDSSEQVFSRSAMHTIELSLSAASLSSLESSPYEHVPGSVVLDGDAVALVAVRLKGKLGSFREVSEKPKWRIDFDRYVPGQTYYGLEALTLNNSVQDCSGVKETLAYTIFAEAGIPAPRTAYADVFVNGIPYGVYVMVEAVDDTFLARHWADSSGSLYDGSYVLDIPGVWLLDLERSSVGYLHLDEGVDVGRSDLNAVVDALDANGGAPGLVASLDPLIDWPAFHAYVAAEQFAGHTDGYGIMPNNYRLYFDPLDGRMSFIPWDPDQAFLYDWEWFTTTWDDPNGRLIAMCWSDPECRDTQQQAMSDLLATLSSVDLDGLLDDLNQLTLPSVLADPKRDCWEDVGSARERVRSWIAGRPDEMRAFWDL